MFNIGRNLWNFCFKTEVDRRCNSHNQLDNLNTIGNYR